MIAEQVFTALDVHAQLEENVFYSTYETMTGKNGTQAQKATRAQWTQTATTFPEEGRGSRHPEKVVPLRPTPLARVGVRAHGLITPPQACEPQ
jgi:hypothetical protein